MKRGSGIIIRYPSFVAICTLHKWKTLQTVGLQGTLSSGGGTRTHDLRIMNPTL